MKEQQIKRPGNTGPVGDAPAHGHAHGHSHSQGGGGLANSIANAIAGQRVALPAAQALPHPQIKPAANPHYAALGGEPAVRALVERFYALMDRLPQASALRALHPADLSGSKERLFLFLSGWLGGPQLYAERFGQPRLRGAHAAFPIDAAGRDAWIDCMTQALQEQVGDEALRAQLIAAFFKTADFLRNQTGA